MTERHCFQIFVLLIFFATVRGFNRTRCLGPYNDSYTCPRRSDPLERTQCCLWNKQPACCLPGGSSCSDSTDKRNYCPRPNDENDRTQCCVWDSQPTCCLSGGSKCSDDADIRNYCPGPNDGKSDRDCCLSDDSKNPICCKKGLTWLWILLGILFGIPAVICLFYATPWICELTYRFFGALQNCVEYALGLCALIFGHLDRICTNAIISLTT